VRGAKRKAGRKRTRGAKAGGLERPTVEEELARSLHQTGPELTVEEALTPAPGAPLGTEPQPEELARVLGELEPEPAPAGEPLRPEVREGPAPKTDAELEAEAAQAEAELRQRLATFDREDMQAALELVFWLVALRRGRHWELEEEEARRLATAFHRSLERHERLMRFLGRWGSDLITAGLLVGVIRKRLEQEAELRRSTVTTPEAGSPAAAAAPAQAGDVPEPPPAPAY
jgi:hypothetical protein